MIKSAVLSVKLCIVAYFPVTMVLFERATENNRHTVPFIHITDRPGGNVYAAIITGRSGIIESAEQSA